MLAYHAVLANARRLVALRHQVVTDPLTLQQKRLHRNDPPHRNQSTNPVVPGKRQILGEVCMPLRDHELPQSDVQSCSAIPNTSGVQRIRCRLVATAHAEMSALKVIPWPVWV